jgi:hypothetical protein
VLFVHGDSVANSAKITAVHHGEGEAQIQTTAFDPVE